MISVIVYGRNDSHGYNLHKRAAISLNAISAVLNDPEDEILFVDCNTPDDFPTFVEAIADTLTDRARSLLRVLRVRPEVYGRHRADSRLPVLEPHCRNVALRRSNPANRWILSTNTDMVFVPRGPVRFLSEVVRELPDGMYELPRFEVPEMLWESIDRRDAGEIIRLFGDWGRRLHLNEVVLGREEIRFDGPGDFQLMLRDQLFEIHGFDEEMIHGWHVDSNIAKRLFLLNGATSSLLDRFGAYHCDHTRQAGDVHASGSKSNDLRHFFDDVEVPHLEGQRDDWGMPSEPIEELRLDDGGRSALEEGLSSVLPGQGDEEPSVWFLEERPDYGLLYDSRHRLPYLVDQLSTLPPGSRIAYVGANALLLDLLTAYLDTRQVSNVVLLHDEIFHFGEPSEARRVSTGRVEVCDTSRLAAAADVFVFDAAMMRFWDDPKQPGFSCSTETTRRFRRDFARVFVDVARAERRRLREDRATRRRFLLIAGIHTWFHPLSQRLLSTTLTPYSAGVRPGYLRDDARFREAATMFEDSREVRVRHWLGALLGR